MSGVTFMVCDQYADWATLIFILALQPRYWRASMARVVVCPSVCLSLRNGRIVAISVGSYEKTCYTNNNNLFVETLLTKFEGCSVRETYLSLGLNGRGRKNVRNSQRKTGHISVGPRLLLITNGK